MTLRGAASIARRLQDPLAELVKIDPKSIGVGQYQHDLSEQKLGRSLDAVVEDCVNAVGVDVNTASAKLLARVSGVGEALAQAIVVHRETHGPFRTRAALKDVPRLGAKAFELSAGFLRITDGDQPLDRSGVHPEAYPVVRRILERLKADIHAVIGNAKALAGLKPADFADERFGVPTVADILKELEKPGRDPRPAFRTAAFKEGVETIADLKPGMVLEGVGDQRRRLRRLRRRRRPPGRACPRLGDGEHLREGPARGREARRRRQGEGLVASTSRASASRSPCGSPIPRARVREAAAAATPRPCGPSTPRRTAGRPQAARSPMRCGGRRRRVER